MLVLEDCAAFRWRVVLLAPEGCAACVGRCALCA